MVQHLLCTIMEGQQSRKCKGRLREKSTYHYRPPSGEPNQSPKAARATDWPTIRSTTLLTNDPESVARKSAFS